MKDPAFLFYSKDFYEGTRMMLPEERACYIDLLIYQHQHGIIPLDLKRVLLYCSGVDEATLQATLTAKFTKTTEGYVNTRLQSETSDREKYKSSQSDNGKVGQFWKKAKAILKTKEFSVLSQNLKDKEVILLFLNENDINKDTLQGLLKQCLNNKGNGDANVNEDKIKKGDGNFEKTELQKAFDEFTSMRIKIKKPMTDRAVQMLETKLTELAGDDESLKVKILNQSTFKNWSDVYPINDHQKQNPAPDRFSHLSKLES